MRIWCFYNFSWQTFKGDNIGNLYFQRVNKDSEKSGDLTQSVWSKAFGTISTFSLYVLGVRDSYSCVYKVEWGEIKKQEFTLNLQETTTYLGMTI